MRAWVCLREISMRWRIEMEKVAVFPVPDWACRVDQDPKVLKKWVTHLGDDIVSLQLDPVRLGYIDIRTRENTLRTGMIALC